MKLTKSTFFLGCLVGGMGAALVPLLINPSKADTKLLPFQGRLTDAGGNAIADGAKVVEFKMYDAPTGGNVKWAGEVHKLSVNGGLVNTMLGSKASLGSVDFADPTFLQISVDANADGQITAADPPLLPRQSVVPAVFAMEAGHAKTADLATNATSAATAVDATNATNATKLAGADWSALFDNGDPNTGKIPTARLASDRGITPDKLSARNIAISAAAAKDAPTTTEVDIATVELTTTGRPVLIGLTSGLSPGDSFVGLGNATGDAVVGEIRIYRSTIAGSRGNRVSIQRFGLEPGGGSSTAPGYSLWLPPGGFSSIETPGANTYYYTITIRLTGESSVPVVVQNVRVFAVEL